MMYFVSDIDGTLLAQPGDRVIQGVPEALRVFQKCGVRLVLASNRCLGNVILAAKRLGIEEYLAVCSGGRYVVEMGSGGVVEVLYQNFDIRKGIEYARNGRQVIFQDIEGNLSYVDWSTKPRDLWQAVSPITERNLRNTPQANFILQFDGTWAQAEKLAGRGWYPWQYGGVSYIEDRQVDKGVGLRELLLKRGSGGIAVVGDDTNDFPMFELAQDVYVMGNASQGLRSMLAASGLAYTVVSGVEDGGVINAIAHLISKYSELQHSLNRVVSSEQLV